MMTNNGVHNHIRAIKVACKIYQTANDDSSQCVLDIQIKVTVINE